MKKITYKSSVVVLLSLLLFMGCSDGDKGIDDGGEQEQEQTEDEVDTYVANNSDPNGYVDTSKWKLIWEDQFDYPNTMLDNNWTADNTTYEAYSTYLCSRWRDNAVVDDKNSVLNLFIKKEVKGTYADASLAKEWTAASLYTKKAYLYGYFECRYKYASAYSNNSFWIMQSGNTAIPDGCAKIEIDINEGHYPNLADLNMRNWSVTSDNVLYSNTTYHSFGDSKQHDIELDKPITARKLRFSSIYGSKFHLQEFRAFSTDGGTNYMLEDGVTFECSGVYNDKPESYGAHRIADGNAESSSWITQDDGEKWVEIDLGESREIGSMNLVTGWNYTSSNKVYNQWVIMINNYLIEYENEDGEWVEAASWDVRDKYDFSKEFHTTGLAWTEDELVYYFDGEEIRREVNTFCKSEANVILSIALLDFLGTPDDSDSGDAMVVDYVRIYEER